MIAVSLIRRHGGAAPADDWENRVSIPASYIEACQEAIELEREHATLYKQLLERDVDSATRRVLIRIQNVSRNNHQLNFQAYLDFARSGERRVMNF